jgi:hypothetical protein
MTINLNTRKPIDAITSEDLQTFPIWEFAIDEEGQEDQDETWIRPLACASVPLNESAITVATSFTTASGLQIWGATFVSTYAGIEIDGFALLLQNRYITIPPSSQNIHKKVLEDFIAALKLTSAEIFPMKYVLAVPIENQTTSIQGLLSYPSLRI